MKQIQGGVTAAKGFEAAGVEAAIKYQNRKDMALIVSKAPCTVAGTFTSNVVKAAPVLWDKQIVEHSAFAQAVVVNSGIANACTGKQGLDCCEAEAKCAGELLGVPTDAVLVASTGVIGMQIPVDKITAGIEKLVAAKADTLEAGSDAAHAIMTTDTISKEIAIETQIGGKTVTLGGMCKGSGMIHPNMCTMLGFVTTDVKISKEMLQKCVSADVVDSFNMISVDGDTSTNDTLLVLANGMAGNEEITAEGEDYDNFCKALHEITTFLAKKMAGDGEGATALFETKVINAVSKEDARTLAKSVICSSPRQLSSDMMPTGDVSSVHWVIPEPNSTRKMWICILRARAARFISSVMVWHVITARKRPRRSSPIRKSPHWWICIWVRQKLPHGAVI